jgi:hypothetical protein
MIKGIAGYVLPRFDNKVYFFIETGNHFGHTDLASDKALIEDGTNKF